MIFYADHTSPEEVILRRQIDECLEFLAAECPKSEWIPRHQREKRKDLSSCRPRLYAEQSGECPGCFRHYDLDGMDIDHIVPLAAGGTNDPGNLQLLCKTCNQIKGTGTMSDLLARSGAKQNGHFCHVCREYKPAAAFYADLSRSGGRSSKCRACDSRRAFWMR